MNILLVNDDGIYSQGILTLAKRLLPKHDVTLVAPQGQMSGMGHSITYYGHVNFTELKMLDCARCFAVNGTPADCVKVALNLIMDRRPDLIISGINKGFNLGSDIFYSGTVNAALEACVQGIKALAISQEYHIENFDFTSDFVAKNLQKFYDLLPDDAQTILNINVPCGNENDIKGVKFCKVGVKVYNETYTFENNLGYKLRGLGEKTPNAANDEDVYLYDEKYITVSAVKNDWNDYAFYERLGKEGLKL